MTFSTTTPAVEPRIKNGPALAGYGAEAMREAIASKITTMPEQLRRTLTWDRGKKLAQYAQPKIDTNVAVYFCAPRAPGAAGAEMSSMTTDEPAPTYARPVDSRTVVAQPATAWVVRNTGAAGVETSYRCTHPQGRPPPACCRRRRSPASAPAVSNG